MPSSASSPAGFPRQFDSYVLLKPLARGGMGQLYLALAGTPGLEKLCVVKKVTARRRRARERAPVPRRGEGRAAAVARQPGPVFDAGLQGERIFLAMDYVDGRTCARSGTAAPRSGSPFPVDIAVYIVKELCRGPRLRARASRTCKLVHRDVSPPNVLLSFSGEVKLTDFGLATSTLKMEKTAPGIIYGKVSYLAPEQARGEPLDGRTDLYAAGIMLWELLTGRQLFPVARARAAGSDDAERRRAPARARSRMRPRRRR